MPYSRPYPGGFVDYPSTTTPINSTALNTMDVGIKTANDQFQTVTTAQRTALTPSVGQAVWDSDLRQLMVYMNASGGNAWQAVGNIIVCTSTTRPSTPFEGQVIRETDTNRELTYSGTAWVQTNQWSTTSGVTGVNNLIVPPACQLRRTTNLTSYASNTDITFDTTANYDTDGMFSSGTPTTITIQTTGLYLVSFTGLLTGTATMTNFDSLLFKSGSEIVRNGHWSSATGAYFAMHVTVSLTAADTLTARLITVGGSAYVVGGNASNGSQTRFTATWIGRTS